MSRALTTWLSAQSETNSVARPKIKHNFDKVRGSKAYEKAVLAFKEKGSFEVHLAFRGEEARMILEKAAVEGIDRMDLLVRHAIFRGIESDFPEFDWMLSFMVDLEYRMRTELKAASNAAIDEVWALFRLERREEIRAYAGQKIRELREANMHQENTPTYDNE